MAATPRSVITPSAFTVAPELLGYSLAAPSRRLLAIGVDALLAAIIAGTPVHFLVAAGGALFAWRAIAGPAERLLAGRGRSLFRGAAAVLALIVIINIGGELRERVRDLGSDDVAGTGAAAPANENGEVEIVLEELDLSRREQATFLMELAALGLANDEEAVNRAGELGGWVREHTPAGEPRDRLIAALSEMMEPAQRTAFQHELGLDTVAPTPPAPVDSLALLAAQNRELEGRNARLREALEEAGESRGRGVRSFLSGISDDLGLGFGWFALYFTAFAVLGRGQTPGKWLLHIKVIRLDNRPIGWWIAFERFGGYAASFSTGLLGFAQILWDANRQALHDKAVGTVVIRLKDGLPVRAA